MSDRYHISIEESTPIEYRDKVPLWLDTVLDFLTAVPRPQSKSLPAIESLIPDFSEIRFSVGDHFCPPHGLFSRTEWTGYMVLPVKDNGDLLLQTQPHLTLFMNQDVALATMVCWVHLLDQMFLVYKHPETHLYRQIQFLEKFAPQLHKQFIKERNAANTKAQMKAKRGRKPVGYVPTQLPTKPQYGAPPAFKPYIAPATTAPPQAKPSESEAQVIERVRHMWTSIESGTYGEGCYTETPIEPGVCEDHDL